MNYADSQGWIKLYRQIQDNEFWFSEKFTKAQAWIDLLVLANHSPATVFLRGIEIPLARGQSARSQVLLAQRWRWNERTVKRFLQMLEKRNMAQSKTNNVCTIITICNYDRYQNITEQTTEQNMERQQSRIHTNKNEKNVLNEKNGCSKAQQLFEKVAKKSCHPTDIAHLSQLCQEYSESEVIEAIKEAHQRLSRSEIKFISVKLLSLILSDWKQFGKPPPKPEFKPCGKNGCDNGLIAHPDKNSYSFCECKVSYDSQLEQWKTKGGGKA